MSVFPSPEYGVLAAAAVHADEELQRLLLDVTASDEQITAAEQAAAAARQLRDRMARELRAAATAGATPATTVPAPARVAGSRPTAVVRRAQRDLVADVLQVLGAPARTADLQAAARLLFDVTLTAAQLTQLRREERRQFERAQQSPATNARPWYVVPCLSADTLAPARGTYALSSWPAADRIITPFSTRLWAVHAAVNVAKAVITSARAGTDGTGLQALLALLSRGTSWAATAPRDERSDAAAGVQAADQVVQAAAADLDYLRDRHLADCAGAVEQLQELTGRFPLSIFGRELTAVDDAHGRRGA